MSQGLGFGKKNLIEDIIKHNWGVENPEKKNFSYQELLFVIQEMLEEEGKHYHERTKKHFKRGHHMFREFVKLLLYRNLANYDSMVLLTSEKGTGKSSAAIMMAREWLRLQGKKFNPKKNIAYNNADVMNRISESEPFQVIIADEAVRFASAAEWSKAENKTLKKKLAEVRTKHLLFILCFPLKVEKLEKNYLDSFVNYWVDLFARGVGAIYVKDRNPGQDSWRMKQFSKIGSYNEFTTPNKVAQVLKKHPNFWQVIKFPKPSKSLYSNYLKVREANVYNDDNVFATVTAEDVNKALLVLSLRDVMMHDSSLSVNRIILHIKNEYDINITSKMVKSAVDDAKQLVNRVRDEIPK